MAKNSTAKVQPIHSAKKPANVPATKTLGTKGAAVKQRREEVEEADEEEDEEEEDTAPTKGGKKNKAKVKKNQRAMLTARVNNIVKRLEQIAKHCRNTESVAELAEKAHEAAQALSLEVFELPNDWQRARKEKLTQQHFAVGDIVAVSSGWRKKYDGLIDDSEMDELRVLKKAQQKNGHAVYSVQTGDGARLFIAAAHLRKG